MAQYKRNYRYKNNILDELKSYPNGLLFIRFVNLLPDHLVHYPISYLFTDKIIYFGVFNHLSMDQTTVTSKTCEHCKKVLHGRSDQRFCNNTFRNTFNRNKREYEKVSMPDGALEIIKVIKRNYEILKRDIPGQIVDRYGNIQCDTNIVLQGGLNLKFYTSSYNSGGDKWYCVFDRCYSIKGDDFFITDSRDQLNLET